MPYTVEVTLADPPSPTGEAETQMYPLPETFDTIADAKEAAIGHIVGLGRDPEAVLYTVMDQNGLTVMTSLEMSQ